jgi:hypothetical protein
VATTSRPEPDTARPVDGPPVDQDKPTGPPPRPEGAIPRTTRWDFHFDGLLRPASLLVGVVPSRTEVVVGEETFLVRFGHWSLETPLANVAETSVTGPYSWYKVAGPPHLSFADGGLTFATTTRRGACVRFHEPVAAALPVGLLRHPAVTVTVADPEAMVAELDAAVRRDRHARR